MQFTLENTVKVLRDAGLTVNTDFLSSPSTDGYLAELRGLILHHDAGGLSYYDDWNGHDNTSVAQNMANPGTPGAQFWVGRSGTWYILCIGYKWHAGVGAGYGEIPANSGNKYALGVETDYGPVRPGWSGATVKSEGYTWPIMDVVQRQAIYDGTAALVKAFVIPTQCAHKEYAPDRKIDIANFDLDEWRNYITHYNPGPHPEPPDPEDWLNVATEAEVRAVFHEELSKFFGTDPAQKTPKVRIATVVDGKEKAADTDLSDAIANAATNAARALLSEK